MESKYTALSMSLGAAIPMMAISAFINIGLGLNKDQFLVFKATVLHEDNLGSLTLATLVEPDRYTPSRSMFYSLRMHWFCSWLKPNEIRVKHTT